jgi:phage repressor protein C with HTH and peptisase S24 domain
MIGILPAETFADRVQILIKKLGSQEKLGDASGISGVTIGKYALGKADPSRERLIAMADAAGVNVLWLATGKGPLNRDEPVSRDPSPEYKAVRQIISDTDGGVTLQVYVTGGTGDPYELIPSEPIEEIIIPRSFYSAAIIPVKVKGRSMERTLRNGAVVGVDRADKDVVNGELYAVWLPYQGTVIKRLYMDDKKILLQSDNEEFRSRDVEVNISEVDESFIQGRVKWVVQML